MAIIKSFTDLSQSKVLAKILPIENADIRYISLRHKDDTIEWIPQVGTPSKYDIPCWSLAALLDILPKGTNVSISDSLDKIRYSCWNDYDITYADNPVDACVAMVEKLNELNLL